MFLLTSFNFGAALLGTRAVKNLLYYIIIIIIVIIIINLIINVQILCK